jgi:hypothetical protein
MPNEAITLLKRLIDDGVDAPSAHCPSPPPSPPPADGGVRRIRPEREFEREIEREVEPKIPNEPEPPRDRGALHGLLEQAETERVYC